MNLIVLPLFGQLQYCVQAFAYWYTVAKQLGGIVPFAEFHVSRQVQRFSQVSK